MSVLVTLIAAAAGIGLGWVARTITLRDPPTPDPATPTYHLLQEVSGVTWASADIHAWAAALEPTFEALHADTHVRLVLKWQEDPSPRYPYHDGRTGKEVIETRYGALTPAMLKRRQYTSACLYIKDTPLPELPDLTAKKVEAELRQLTRAAQGGKVHT